MQAIMTNARDMSVVANIVVDRLAGVAAVAGALAAGAWLISLVLL